VTELDLPPLNRPPEPLTPYYHPTTACFIDDNEAFLLGLELMLPQYMNSRSFYDPHAALEFINHPPAMPSLAYRCFSQQHNSGKTVFQLNLGLIEQEISLISRFARLSVVIVDYSMPTLNGIELCERIKDPHVGKVLLTGVTDEKFAVEAFNAGIIDRFISKSHPRATENISGFSLSMQQAYFRSQAQQLQSTLGLAAPTFINDPAVAVYVRKLMARKGFCEYYMVNEPPGLIMLRPSGEIQQLVVLTAQALAEQANFARSHGAPDGVVRRLEKASHVGFFMEQFEGYAHTETYPWSNFLHRATALGDAGKTWFAALVKEPPRHIDYQPEEVCHDAYMHNLAG